MGCRILSRVYRKYNIADREFQKISYFYTDDDSWARGHFFNCGSRSANLPRLRNAEDEKRQIKGDIIVIGNFG